MNKFKFIDTGIEGLYIIETKRFIDARGYFMETFNYKDFVNVGLDINFVQENQSKSKKGVIRGLHFQNRYSQDKLVRVIKGKVFDVAVDIRKNSRTYGKWYGITLSDKNKKLFFIPKGFAHGFLSLSGEAELLYKCTEFYHPEDECGIIWDDPTIGIQWPIEKVEKLIISEKDRRWGKLRDYNL